MCGSGTEIILGGILILFFLGMWGGWRLAFNAQVKLQNRKDHQTLCPLYNGIPSDHDCQDDLGMKNGILRRRFLRELAVLRKNADYRCRQLEDFDNIDFQLVRRRGDGKLPQQDFTRVQRLHLQSCHQVIHFRICQLCDWWMPKLIELLMKGHKPGIPFSIEWWWAARDSKGGRDYQLGSQVSL